MKKVVLPHKPELAPQLLRAGLAFVFLYAGWSEVVHPVLWEGFLPNFVTKFLEATAVIKLLGVTHLAMAVWFASGKWLRWAGLVATLMLAGVVLTNFVNLFTTFRDVGLACAAAALFFIEE